MARRASRTASASRWPTRNLYIASQIHAGLDGVQRQLQPPPATESPYADSSGAPLPTSLDAALQALLGSRVMSDGFGPDLVKLYSRIKQSEAARHGQAEDPQDWQRREYFPAGIKVQLPC